ncbi:hypothetical protein REPUB_Repub03eG0271600 [Reevesia pubescens]
MFLGLCQSITIANGFNQSAKEENIQCIETERYALLKLKQSLVDESGQLSSWGSEDGQKDCCLWQGVRCSNRTGHVIMLDLGNNLPPGSNDDFLVFPINRLRGEINPSLLELQHLRYLDLSGIDFGGTQFPNLNGSLSKLSYLDLHGTGLSSTMLYQLGNLSKLRFLDLSGNGYTISNLDWLHSLSSLRYFNLSANNLGDAKDWPQLLTKLPHLEELQLSRCSLPKILSPPSITNSTSSPISIDLSGNNLTSSMYPLLFNITNNIVGLNLQGNSLNGSIPDFFRNMVSLEHLDLSENQLGDEIPEFFGNICTLKTLDLSSNNFSRFVPAGLSGCKQHSLEILSLSNNSFDNSLILSYVTRFSSLRELDLSSNRLNGSFPTSFKQLSELALLNLHNNQLTGPLPDLTKLSSLKHLDIRNNRFNGTVTESLGYLSELEILEASRNSLEGVISEAHFKNLSKLQTLDLSFNHLAFNVSSNWVPPFQLNQIYLSFCKLGLHFPRWLRTQTDFKVLDISDAGISGTIPDWFWELPPYLTALNLSHNMLTGMLPDLSSVKFVSFIGIDLSSNLFEGSLPVFPNNVVSLNLAKNRFSGSVSPLCKMRAGAFLNLLDLSDNLLQVLPDCFFQWGRLKVLCLANNNFSGGIPTSVGSLLSLETLSLHNNSFSGDLPSSLKNCGELKFLGLSQNKLSGSIPGWIGENLSSLIILSLQANEFNGRIPVQICQLANIRILDLSQNTLSGAIPFCLNNLTTMVQKGVPNDIIQYPFWSSLIGNASVEGNYIQKARVKWKGKEYDFERSLGLLRIIDLAGNKLVGEIPDEITRLSELVVLNLSGNNLIGPIPGKIGQLKQLESLDLSNNHLSGRIPDSMADISFLNYLNLSYNNLSGKIPSGTQLQTIGASAFVGNQALCGPPIAEQCPRNDPQPPDDGHTSKEDGDEFRKWLYVGMGSGFFTAFWGVFGSLLLKTSWRHAYFRLLDNWKDSLYVTFILWGRRLQRKFKS